MNASHRAVSVNVAIVVRGDIAIMTSDGSAVITARDPARQIPPLKVSGQSINVFRRQVDGWKLARSVNLMVKDQT